MSTSEVESEENKASRAKKFLAEMKKSLSQVNFERIVQALQTYKKTDDLDVLLTETAVLTEDTNTHSLLCGESSAVFAPQGLLQGTKKLVGESGTKFAFGPEEPGTECSSCRIVPGEGRFYLPKLLDLWEQGLQG